MRRLSCAAWLQLVAVITQTPAYAVKVSGIFGDRMILQREKPVPNVYGSSGLSDNPKFWPLAREAQAKALSPGHWNGGDDGYRR